MMMRSIVHAVLLPALLAVPLAWLSACGPSVVIVPAAAPAEARPMQLTEAPSPAPSLSGNAPSNVGPTAPPDMSAEGEHGYHEVLPNTEPGSEPAPATPASDAAEDDADPKALQRFRPQLDPYGEWIEDARYGTVWVPYANVVGVGFRPYVSAGYWSEVNDGWLWVSDYPFGSVVFHYGRWVWIPGEGWAWVAGNRYAPSWVQFWVTSGGYLGWAPLGPAHYWRSGYAVWVAAPAPRPIVFVSRRHVYSRKVSEHAVSNSRHLQQLQRHARVSTVKAPGHEKTSPMQANSSPAARPNSAPAALGNSAPAHASAPHANSSTTPERDLSKLPLHELPRSNGAPRSNGMPANSARTKAVSAKSLAPGSAGLNGQSGASAKRRPAKVYSSLPRRAGEPTVRQTWAGGKPQDRAADAKRVEEIEARRGPKHGKATRSSAGKGPKPAVIHPIVAPPKFKGGKPKSPSVKPAPSKAAAPKAKAHPPMPRVRKVPEKMKLPPRRFTRPPQGHHTPAPRRKH